jgi:hypothetical protein
MITTALAILIMIPVFASFAAGAPRPTAPRTGETPG